MPRLSRDRVRTWRSSHLSDTQFLRAEYRKQRFDRHFHDEYAIGVIESGCQAFVYDHQRRLDMPHGSVALISPGVVHQGWSGAAEGWRYRMLYPAEAAVREAVKDEFGSGVLPSFNRPVVEDGALYRALSELHAVSGAPNPYGLEVETLFLAAIRMSFLRHAGLCGDPSLNRDRSSDVTRVREMIESRYHEAVTLGELAAAAGLGRFQVLRRFKQTYGLPPHAYLLQVRVRRARSLIFAGGTLADTAAAVGFADQAHMTRVFRQTVGYTPGALARG